MYNSESPISRIALATAIRAQLEKSGWRRDLSADFQNVYEEVYYFGHLKFNSFRVLAYTAVVQGTIQSVGPQSIRLTGVYRDESTGKETKVTDTVEIFFKGTLQAITTQDLLNAMRQVYLALNFSHPLFSPIN